MVIENNKDVCTLFYHKMLLRLLNGEWLRKITANAIELPVDAVEWGPRGF